MKKLFKFPFSVAEISANHNGCLRNAKDSLKLQKMALKLLNFKHLNLKL